jgi:S-adenosylmethionine hydrolase
MKAAILAVNSKVQILDITHDVPNHDLLSAAFTLSNVFRLLPVYTVFVAVVDPGVGTQRRPILVVTENYYFIGPDNGVFSFIYDMDRVTNVYVLDATHYHRSEVSQTFHGRDIFAPAAGWLSKGIDSDKFGSPISDYGRIPIPKPEYSGKTVTGMVLHMDKFGNLITNIRWDDLRQYMSQGGSKSFVANAGGKPAPGPVATYGGAKTELFALSGSTGYIEIAAYKKPARDLVKGSRGMQIQLQLQ